MRVNCELVKIWNHLGDGPLSVHVGDHVGDHVGGHVGDHVGGHVGIVLIS